MRVVLTFFYTFMLVTAILTAGCNRQPTVVDTDAAQVVDAVDGSVAVSGDVTSVDCSADCTDTKTK